jgi:type 1 glutamine amidotransferase
MKSCLIVWGGCDAQHPCQKAELIAALLDVRGFNVTLADSLDAFADPARLAAFDLIVPLWTGGELTDALESNLLAAVRGGAGLGSFHGGMVDAFRANAAFHFMVGGQFVASPDGVRPFTVTLTQPSHPLVHGLDDFSIESTVYYMQVDPGNNVLAATTIHSHEAPWVNGTQMPVVWTRQYGAGRVFYSSLGQTPQSFERPEVLEITKRGLLWASR